MKISVSDKFVLRLEKGDEIVATIIDFCTSKDISFATFNVIGAVSAVDLAVYHLDQKQYTRKSFSGPFEIASMNGNVARLNDKYIVHVHGVFSDTDFDCKAGHVDRATVSATAEVIVQTYSQNIFRKRNDDIGLNLLDL